MRIGETEAHSVLAHPWKAEDIAWLPNGDFYTVGLARVDRFNAAGELQSSLLSPGSGPGQFADLHGIVLDLERHRILLCDRGNSRIQVFDDEWSFIEEWPNIYAPYAMRMQSSDGHIWIADGFTSEVPALRPGRPAGRLVGAVGHRARLHLGYPLVRHRRRGVALHL